MRRFAFLGALVLGLTLTMPVQAVTPATWAATVNGADLHGAVTVTAPTTTTSARLVADLTGLRPATMASLYVYGGKSGTSHYLVVRVRWVGSFSGGAWRASVALTPQMWSWFSYDVAHRGGAHVMLVQGTRATSAMLIRR